MISSCRRNDFIIRIAWTLSRLDLLYRFPSSTTTWSPWSRCGSVSRGSDDALCRHSLPLVRFATPKGRLIFNFFMRRRHIAAFSPFLSLFPLISYLFSLPPREGWRIPKQFRERVIQGRGPRAEGLRRGKTAFCRGATHRKREKLRLSSAPRE